MSASKTRNPRVTLESLVIKPPSHPTYDLKGIIKLALAEDAGDLGFILSLLKLYRSHIEQKEKISCNSLSLRFSKVCSYLYLNFVVPFVGDVTCMATLPADMVVEAHFLAKEDGIIAGIAIADMIFDEVDPLLEVLSI